MCQRASNALQCHHHRRVYSVLTSSSARWDPSEHDVVSQHSSLARMLEEGCSTSRDLALSVVIALIQHIATSFKTMHFTTAGRSLILGEQFEQSSNKLGSWNLGCGSWDWDFGPLS